MKPAADAPASQDSVSPRISYRLAIASTIAAGIALLLAVLLLIVVESVILRSALLDETRVEAELIAENVAAAMVFQDSKSATEIIRTLHASSIFIGAAAIDNEGATLAAYPMGFGSPGPDYRQFGDTDHRFSLHRLEMLVPIRNQRDEIGRLYLVVSTSAFFRQVGIFALVSLSIELVALLVAYTLLSRVRHSVRQAEQRLTHQAHVDAVTGLANRNAFNERLEFATSEGGRFGDPLAMLLLDLDNFKQVNDTLGHHAGDDLLRQVAQRLLRTMRRDDIVARLGGDEFAVILKGVRDRGEVAQVCTKIVEAFAAPYRVMDTDFFVTASIGGAVFPEDARDPHALTRNADTAMYRAKMAGKNAFEMFLPEMNADVKKRVSLESSLRLALDRQELSLHYQPQIDVMSGRLLGFEALLRWCSPEHGNVSPVDFIPIAEDSGMIVPIGDWVIAEALKDIRAWNDGRAHKLKVAVNLSARQLRVEGIDTLIARQLVAAAVPAEWLEIELTESMVMENVHAQIEAFQRLKELGVRLSVDDFGTGYSSMSYLKRLPIHNLKIDRSFVNDISRDSNDLAIATAIVALGHSLGLTVTAEGIETEAQAEALLNLGCDIGQGYLYSRPMPAGMIADFIARHG